MADLKTTTDPAGAGTTAPGAAYLHLTPNMQAFYAARGMWIDGRPAGMLSTMLGDPTPWKGQYGAVCFWVTHGQLQALRDDLAQSNAPAMLSTRQIAQFLRRLRDAETRSGLPHYAASALLATPNASAVSPRSRGRVAAPAIPPAPGSRPFTELVCPPPGTKARKAFEKHVFDCVRDLVDFQQTAAYGE
jgi:hypothetical protein